MKNLKLFLDDEQEEDLSLGLIRLVKNIPDYEFFYHINSQNELKFKRIDDLIKSGMYNDYAHARFEAYHFETKTSFQVISNKSIIKHKKKEQQELFSDEEEINYLLPFHQDVDYIIKTSDNIGNFSLILPAENLMFPIQDFKLSSNDELYELIQYYE